jgi:RNA exonuclease 4
MNNSLLERLDDDELLAHVFFIGLDCEMVGVGKGGEESMLARCSCCCFEDESRSKIKVLFDKFIRPTKAVTDYRTEFSGITPEILKRQDGSVVTFEQCRNYVLQLLSSTPDGRVVVCVGHGLENDFEVLKIQVSR